jgi:hypothetical protein
MTADPVPLSLPFRTDRLPARKPQRFRIEPDAAARAALAAYLDISAVHAFSFEGALYPEGRADVRLEARLKARIVQPCAVTLAPVETAIDEPVLRRYVADLPEPAAEEVEVPEDTDTEPLPEVIDAGHVAAEALALPRCAPRKSGACVPTAQRLRHGCPAEPHHQLAPQHAPRP